VPFQRAEQPGGASLPHRSASPGNRVRAGPEPQPPAGRHGDQSAEDQPQPGRQQAAKDSPAGADPEGDGDPPGQGPDPGRPLGRPGPPPPRLSGAARTAHAGP
jgi:hypothetical protein